jgi:hypothetical protein
MTVFVIVNCAECRELRRRFADNESGKLLCSSYVEQTLLNIECEIHVEEVIDIPINLEVENGHKHHSHRFKERTGNERGREEAERSETRS